MMSLAKGETHIGSHTLNGVYESTVSNCVDEFTFDDDLTFSTHSWPESVNNVAVSLVLRFIITKGGESTMWAVSEFEACAGSWADEVDNDLYFVVNLCIYSITLVLIWELFVKDRELVSRAAATVVLLSRNIWWSIEVGYAYRFP